jgi:hypothetical protein
MIKVNILLSFFVVGMFFWGIVLASRSGRRPRDGTILPANCLAACPRTSGRTRSWRRSFPGDYENPAGDVFQQPRLFQTRFGPAETGVEGAVFAFGTRQFPVFGVHLGRDGNIFPDFRDRALFSVARALRDGLDEIGKIWNGRKIPPGSSARWCLGATVRAAIL